MSKLLESLVWQSNLKAELKPVAAVVADMGNDDGRGIYPSVAYLAWLLSCSERSIQRTLKQLSDLGILKRISHNYGGRGNVPHYRLIAHKLPERPPWNEARKGDNLTPFRETDSVQHVKRVTSTTIKGDILSIKGDKMTPDPLVDPLVDPKTPLPPEGERAKKTHLADVKVVFTYWQQRLKHPQAKLDDKRTRLIQARLKDYTVEDLKSAVDGCLESPFHMGQNDTGHVHDDIALICRDSSHVEMFIGKLTKKPVPAKDSSTAMMAEMGIDWKPRSISTPEEYAALSGKPVEEVKAKWN